jgi:hypothetical protein
VNVCRIAPVRSVDLCIGFEGHIVDIERKVERSQVKFDGAVTALDAQCGLVSIEVVDAPDKYAVVPMNIDGKDRSLKVILC